MHSYIALAAMYILKTGFDLSVMKNAPLSGFINPISQNTTEDESSLTEAKKLMNDFYKLLTL